MRISDWSSDVCSSDLLRLGALAAGENQLGTEFGYLLRGNRHPLPLDQPGLLAKGLDRPLRGHDLFAQFRDALVEPGSGQPGRFVLRLQLFDEVEIGEGVRDPRRDFLTLAREREDRKSVV